MWGLDSLKIFQGGDENGGQAGGGGEEPVDVYNSRPLPFIIGEWWWWWWWWWW